MGMMQEIYGEINGNPATQASTGSVSMGLRAEKDAGECRRATIAETVVRRVKEARREQQTTYRLERFAELGDRHPEVLEMLEIGRDCGMF